MKQLLSLVALLAILGLAGFLYRATLEAPTHGTSAVGIVCPEDAKVCPDGSSVVRSGPSCTFAACALPNVEIPEAGISFALPTGFSTNENAYGTDTTLIGAFEKSGLLSTSTAPDSIVVRRYPIPEGKDANAVMLEHTMYESSGNQPKSIGEFTPVIINGKTFQMVTVERFEALVHTEYYLPREKDVLRFEALQHNVTNWTDPTLRVRSLSMNVLLETMLATLQTL